MVFVKEKVDQDMLPPEDRIPGELRGVPIQLLPTEIGKQRYAGRVTRSQSDIEPHYDLVLEVIRKNADLFKGYPFSKWWAPKHLYRWEEYEELTEADLMWGIEVAVSKRVDNLSLSPTRRIPDCLEDVPVMIIVNP